MWKISSEKHSDKERQNESDREKIVSLTYLPTIGLEKKFKESFCRIKVSGIDFGVCANNFLSFFFASLNICNYETHNKVGNYLI